MPIRANYFLPSMPEGLDELSELAMDLRWSWNHDADRLWKQIAPELWARTGNPWLILQNVSTARLNILAADPVFRKMLGDYVASYRDTMGKPSWFQQAHAELPLTVAYFSMEFGLSEALPIYLGGLGILAGDYMKTARQIDEEVRSIMVNAHQVAKKLLEENRPRLVHLTGKGYQI
jgi:starch phosphorylase